MQLKRVSYKSAIFFGVFGLVMYLLLGILQMVLSSSLGAELGIEMTASTVLTMALTGGFTILVLALLAILIYNIVAKKFPIAWDVGK